MNRRNLFQRAGAAAIGALAALIGIRPKKAKALGLSDAGWGDFPSTVLLSTPGALPGEFSNAPLYKIELNNPDGEPLRLWVNDRFYVDLPEDRYKDSVCVDWAIAQEWENLYVAQCRVCPDFDEPWEVLPMKRVDG